MATALTADFNSYSKNISSVQDYVVKTSQVIYRGALVSLDASGNLIPATSSSALGRCVGRAAKSTDGTEAAGTKIPVERGSFWFNLDGSNPPTQAYVGKKVYATSDHEVAYTGTTVAGILEALENSGALVRVEDEIGS